ncbi:hypothetical protein [Bacillus testis]|uniref:hypothetical protein n=1 Tax=Bacillus testis TaxID=1622072 RepID=UPI00067F0932|nr:hypothetical protein [Bacillus testis]
MNNPYSPYFQYNIPLPANQYSQNQQHPLSEDHQRILPPTQPERLRKSAEHTKTLLSDLVIVNETIRTSPEFSQRLVNAASQSDHQTVHYMINNLAIENRAVVSYTPGGISITLLPKDASNSCCYVVMFLNWKESF